jgi:hypothetical protein
LKAQIEADTRFPHLQWSTYSFRYGVPKKDAIRLFLSYIGWVARDVEGHIKPLMSVENVNGSVHLHCVIASDLHLKWRELHGRWYKNLGFSAHKLYDRTQGAVIYLAEPRHTVVILDEPITCGFPSRCKNRRRGCSFKKSNNQKRMGNVG